MTIGIDQIFNNLSTTTQYLTSTVGIFAMLAGLVITGMGILKFKEVGDGRVHLGTPVTYLLVGAALFSMSDMMNDFSDTLFGSNNGNVAGNLSDQSDLFRQAALSGGNYTQAGLSGVFLFIQLIGNIAFVRGFFLLKAASDGKDGSLGKGFIHILGGCAAVNLGTVIKMVGQAAGLL